MANLPRHAATRRSRRQAKPPSSRAAKRGGAAQSDSAADPGSPDSGGASTGPRRGRPRSLTARAKILAAARSLLEERGLTGVTMEGIAARAEVGKPTVYRYWPNAQAVAMDAFLDTAELEPGAQRREPALVMLRRHLRGIAAAFASTSGRSTAAMIAAAQNDSELAKVFRNRFIMQSRQRGRALLERAAAEGEIAPPPDIEVALDLIYAPLYFRLLIGHGRLDAAFTDALLELALRGLRR